MTRCLAILACALATLVCRAEDLRVMTWNVQKGAIHFENGPEKALKVISDAGANLVLMQESFEIEGDRPQLGPWLASQLGWQSHQPIGTHLCILTKFEITKTFSHNGMTAIGARIKTPELEFNAWSCWIDYLSYLPDYWHANPNATAEELLACETKHSQRARQTASIVSRLKWLRQINGKLPLLVGGDWNCPSHLDYGQETLGLHGGLTLPLPSSLAFERAGFIDTFRAIHPSVIKTPGVTWSPLYRFEPKTHLPMPMDRIDRLYLLGGQLQPISTKVFPEVWEANSLSRPKRRFPSDHCSVLTVLRVVPGSGGSGFSFGIRRGAR